MTDIVATTLNANGFEPLQIGAVHSTGGSTRTWAAAAWTPTLNHDATPRCVTRRNLLSLEFRYMSARHLDRFSKVARRLSDTLVKLLATGETRPLVRLTPTSTQIVYRVETLNFLGFQPPFKNGLQTRDELAVLSLQLTSSDLPVDGAAWWEGRSPLTVQRDALPEWNSEETSRSIHELVNRLVASGDLRIC
jgi:hypothetical protein